MERKIFNSVDSRIKRDLDSEFKSYTWWLHSADILLDDRDPHQYLGYVHFTSHIGQIFPDYSFGISPACTI